MLDFASAKTCAERGSSDRCPRSCLRPFRLGQQILDAGGCPSSVAHRHTLSHLWVGPLAMARWRRSSSHFRRQKRRSYARRQGIELIVRGPGEEKMSRLNKVETWQSQRPEPVRNGRKQLECVGRTSAADAIREPSKRDSAPVNPAACFASPSEVVRDPILTAAQKRDVLQRWALDEYLIQVGMTAEIAQGKSVRLDEVIDALIDLDNGSKMTATSRMAQARTMPTRVKGHAA
jgi:hypothetical protein